MCHYSKSLILTRTFELLTFFTAGIGSVLATAIFNVLNIDPVMNAVISLDQCKKKISYVIIHLLKPPLFDFSICFDESVFQNKFMKMYYTYRFIFIYMYV